MPDVHRLRRIVIHSREDQRASAWLFDIHRFVMHVRHHELARFPAAPDVIAPALNLEARVAYLGGQLSESRFKAILQKREKARRRNDSVHQVLRTVVDVATDMFVNVVRSGGDAASVEAVRRDMPALVDFANESLCAVSRRYGCVVPVMDHRTWATPLTKRRL